MQKYFQENFHDLRTFLPCYCGGIGLHSMTSCTAGDWLLPEAYGPEVRYRQEENWRVQRILSYMWQGLWAQVHSTLWSLVSLVMRICANTEVE